ncbi:hypothetical protein SAZ11_55695 [Streptomyces sp. FXJ1.4098]|nr:hypothetical protein [Streptomyces sp. FXJ1.4098]
MTVIRVSPRHLLRVGDRLAPGVLRLLLALFDPEQRVHEGGGHIAVLGAAVDGLHLVDGLGEDLAGGGVGEVRVLLRLHGGVVVDRRVAGEIALGEEEPLLDLRRGQPAGELDRLLGVLGLLGHQQIGATPVAALRGRGHRPLARVAGAGGLLGAVQLPGGTDSGCRLAGLQGVRHFRGEGRVSAADLPYGHVRGGQEVLLEAGVLIGHERVVGFGEERLLVLVLHPDPDVSGIGGEGGVLHLGPEFLADFGELVPGGPELTDALGVGGQPGLLEKIGAVADAEPADVGAHTHHVLAVLDRAVVVRPLHPRVVGVVDAVVGEVDEALVAGLELADGVVAEAHHIGGAAVRRELGDQLLRQVVDKHLADLDAGVALLVLLVQVPVSVVDLGGHGQRGLAVRVARAASAARCREGDDRGCGRHHPNPSAGVVLHALTSLLPCSALRPCKFGISKVSTLEPRGGAAYRKDSSRILLPFAPCPGGLNVGTGCHAVNVSVA